MAEAGSTCSLIPERENTPFPSIQISCPGICFTFVRETIEMKSLYLLLLLLVWSGALAQDTAEDTVRQTIELFFKGFHQKDSNLLKETVSPGVILQTIATSNDGKHLVRTEAFDVFLKTITGIPDSVKFQEVINDYKIEVDGPMAHVWTPYEFWLNEQFSHCGVNSFQLVREEERWKIIYLIDTRRKEDCP